MTFCSQCETYLLPEAAVCPACGTAAPAPMSPALAWALSLPAPPYSAPVAFDGGVLVASGSPRHTALLEWCAGEHEQPRWQRSFDLVLITGLLVVEDRLFFSLTSTDLLRGQGALVALDSAGDEVWRWSPGHGMCVLWTSSRWSLGRVCPCG